MAESGRLETGLDFGELGFTEVTLMPGERSDLTLDLKGGLSEGGAGDRDIVLLTDRRVVRLTASGSRRQAVFMSLEDVDSVEISSEKGFAAFIWAALGFFAAIMLWNIWDHPVGHVVLPLVVAGMGVYLIVDHVLSAGNVTAVLRAGTSALRLTLKGGRAAAEVYGFANRLYELKARPSASRPPQDAQPKVRFSAR